MAKRKKFRGYKKQAAIPKQSARPRLKYTGSQGGYAYYKRKIKGKK